MVFWAIVNGTQQSLIDNKSKFGNSLVFLGIVTLILSCLDFVTCHIAVTTIQQEVCLTSLKILTTVVTGGFLYYTTSYIMNTKDVITYVG